MNMSLGANEYTSIYLLRRKAAKDRVSGARVRGQDTFWASEPTEKKSNIYLLNVIFKIL